MVTPLLRSRPAGAAAAAAAGGWTKRDGALETFVPRDATGGLGITAGAAWAWSAYTQLTAGLTDPFIPHVVHAVFRVAPVTTGALFPVFEIEVATGPDGSETLFARFSDAYGVFLWPAEAVGLVATSKTWPCGPNPIAASTRIAFRVRCSLAAAQAGAEIRLYLGGYDTAAPAGYAEPNLDDYLDGDNTARLLTTPSGSFLSVTPAAWGSWGSWVQIIASASQDLLLWGEIHSNPASVDRSRYLEFGTGAGGSETSRARLAIPGGLVPANTGLQLMRRPLYVLSGERLAVRGSGSTAAMNHQFLYSEV